MKTEKQIKQIVKKYPYKDSELLFEDDLKYLLKVQKRELIDQVRRGLDEWCHIAWEHYWVDKYDFEDEEDLKSSIFEHIFTLEEIEENERQ